MIVDALFIIVSSVYLGFCNVVLSVIFLVCNSYANLI